MIKFEIWKLPVSSPNKYMHLDWCKKAVDILDYVMVYSGVAKKCDDINDTLEKLFEKFNVNMPDDYHSESMSVSDLVCTIDINNHREWYFVDGIGFKKLDWKI